MKNAIVLATSSIVLLLFIGIGTGGAHDSWISHGSMRNAAGQWCCGPEDCGPILSDTIDGVATPVARDDGWEVHGWVVIETTKRKVRVDEIVPYSQTLPSPDGQFWRCHVVHSYGGSVTDGERRCFFAPPSGF